MPWNLSMILMILMGGMSLIGLIFTESIYTSQEQILSFMANDVINLIIGLPILLLSMWLTRRGRLVGLLLWPGAVLYLLYNYIAYLFGIPFSLITFAYLALVLLSAIIIFDLLRRIDQHSVKKQLVGAVSEKIAGWILVGFGALFFLRAIAIIVEAGVNLIRLPITEIGLLIADISISAVWIAGGILLLRRRPLGYTSGLGLLFVGSMLFIGLIMVLLLQPILTGAEFSLVDIILVFIMGLVCFIPFGLFFRGVVSVGDSS